MFVKGHGVLVRRPVRSQRDIVRVIGRTQGEIGVLRIPVVDRPAVKGVTGTSRVGDLRRRGVGMRLRIADIIGPAVHRIRNRVGICRPLRIEGSIGRFVPRPGATSVGIVVLCTICCRIKISIKGVPGTARNRYLRHNGVVGRGRVATSTRAALFVKSHGILVRRPLRI